MENRNDSDTAAPLTAYEKAMGGLALLAPLLGILAVGCFVGG